MDVPREREEISTRCANLSSFVRVYLSTSPNMLSGFDGLRALLRLEPIIWPACVSGYWNRAANLGNAIELNR